MSLVDRYVLDDDLIDEDSCGPREETNGSLSAGGGGYAQLIEKNSTGPRQSLTFGFAVGAGREMSTRSSL